MKRTAVLRSSSVEGISEALRLLENNKNFKINGLYASELMNLRENEPELFDRVGEMIKTDRWCPFAGVFSPSDELSPTALIKSCLYSASFFADAFGKTYKVFHGTKIYNNAFAQIVYSSLFDSAILDEVKESCWVHGTEDGFRTLVIGTDSTDVFDCTADIISESEFLTYEEYADETFSAHLDLQTVFLNAESETVNDIELKLLNAEKSNVYNAAHLESDIKNAWIAYLCGDTEKTRDILSRLDTDFSDIEKMFTLSGDGISLSEVKFTEDGSRDVIVRTRETEGREKGAYLMCPRLNAGFRFEIMPYEIQTFRIKNDGSGNVTEIYICE